MNRSANGVTLSSPKHPLVRPILELRQRNARDRRGRYLGEGLRFVARAAERPGLIETLLVCDQLLSHPTGRRLVDRLRASGTPCLSIAPALYLEMARSGEPQGIAAVAQQNLVALDDLVAEATARWLVVESIRSPGNLGSILRTAEAVGVAGVILVGPAGARSDPFDPAAVRASMGALPALRLARASGRELAAWTDRHEIAVVGTIPGAPDYRSIVYPERVAVLVGNERRGLAAEHRALCDRAVGIPMAGRGDSLNVAVATGIVLYELFDQHRRAVATGLRAAMGVAG
jgi:RNA methyltransferase, TrmH family